MTLNESFGVKMRFVLYFIGFMTGVFIVNPITITTNIICFIALGIFIYIVGNIIYDEVIKTRIILLAMTIRVGERDTIFKLVSKRLNNNPTGFQKFLLMLIGKSLIFDGDKVAWSYKQLGDEIFYLQHLIKE